MPDANGFPHGTPSWTDLGTPDVDAAAAFYGGLFGWEAVAAEPVEVAGGYHFFKLRDRMVAGVGPLMSDDQPTAWLTYVNVDSADAIATAVGDAGGQTMLGPMDITDSGRMGIFADAVGAVFGVWQPGTHQGVGIVNEHGSLTWNELASRDIDTAKSFYDGVFGWASETAEMGPALYTTWSLADQPIAGMVQMDAEWPESIPPHWMTYFAVDDTDAVVTRAEELGGSVGVPPTDIPVGRFAVLADPAGAHFSVIKLAEQPPD